MRLLAYGKLNLGLSILGKREDGYHNIETIMQLIDFYDEIIIIKDKKLTDIELATNKSPYGKENICYVSAEKFFNSTGIKPCVRIELRKNLWLGAGLGGGSSDVACILFGLNKLFNSPLKYEELMKIGLEIGSDVPFFLFTKYFSTCAYVTGRGEIIESLPPIDNLFFLLVYPNFSVSTSWAYNNLKIDLTNKKNYIKLLKESIMKGNVNINYVYNDFDELLFNVYPVMNDIKSMLISRGAICVSITGSGSCIYGIFDKEMKLNALNNYKIKLVKPIRGSSNGRTQDFGSCNDGSNPSPRAIN